MAAERFTYVGSRVERMSFGHGDRPGQVDLWLGDCRRVLPDAAPDLAVHLVLTDPPYGCGERTDRAKRNRSILAAAADFPAIVGDDGPFDPSHLLAYGRLFLFGANWYADKLPASGSWVVWDKRAGLTSKRGDAFNDNGDAELAWTNLGGPVRVWSQRWMGMLRDGEREPRIHPTQKPVDLLRRVIETYTKPGDLVLDPYAGSGSTLLAAALCGRRAVGVEIDETYYWAAAARLEKHFAQGVLDL